MRNDEYSRSPFLFFVKRTECRSACDSRSTYNEESNFVKPGRLIVDRPLRTLEGDSRVASSSISTSMSAHDRITQNGIS